MLKWNDINATPFDWAKEFDEQVKSKLLDGNFSQLIDYNNFGISARYSVPTNEHYLPMLYSIAAQEKNEQLEFLYEGFQYGSASMRCFKIG